MIYQVVSLSQFCDSFGIRDNNFSYEGKCVLFEWLDSREENTELDIISLCCDYQESDYETIIDDYGIDIGDLSVEDDEREVYKIIKKYLEHNTIVVGEVAGGFVFASF